MNLRAQRGATNLRKIKVRKKRIDGFMENANLCVMKDNIQFDIIASAIQFISAYQKEQPTLSEIADHVHISKFHFQKLFRKWAGVTPKQFLQYITVEQAKVSLLKGKSTLETAFDVGLSGNGRLHDVFIKMEACTPGEFKNRGNGIEIKFDEINTPFGRALIAETKKGICKIAFLEENERSEKLLRNEFPNALLFNKLGNNGELAKTYFKSWQVPSKKIGLDLKGTPFQIQVWKALLEIPSSHFLSYQDIAQKIGNPKAVRAVGTAIGKNPIAYLIPCHRVIRSSGEIGSYRWNSNRKMAINGYECLRLS